MRKARSGATRIVVDVIILAVLAGAGIGIYMLYMHFEKPNLTGTYLVQNGTTEKLILNPDGTCVAFQLDEQINGTYQVNGDTLSLRTTDGRHIGSDLHFKGDTIYDLQGEPLIKQK